MTKEQFKQKYNHVFDLDNKSFDYIPNFGVVGFKSASLPFFIQISLNGEIDKDFLYYIKGDMIWEMDVAFFRNQLLDDTPVKNENTGIYSEPGQITMGVEKVQKSKLNALKVPSKYLKRYDIDIDEKTVNKSVTVTFPIKTIDVKPIDTYLTNLEDNLDTGIHSDINCPSKNIGHHEFPTDKEKADRKIKDDKFREQYIESLKPFKDNPDMVKLYNELTPSNVEEVIAKIEQKNKDKGIEIIGDSIYVPDAEFINQETSLPKFKDNSDMFKKYNNIDWEYKPLITDEDVDSFLNSDKVVVDDFTQVVESRIEHVRDLMIKEKTLIEENIKEMDDFLLKVKKIKPFFNKYLI